jgi:hypothetical protein
MKNLSRHHSGADPGWLAEELPGSGKPLALVDRADCCPAWPMVTVVLPPAPGHPVPADLRLCGHHYRASRAALRAAGATVYGADGRPLAPDDDPWFPAAPEPVPPPEIIAQHPSQARRGGL